MRKEDCYFLGKITRKHGLQGYVVLRLDTDQPEIYNQMESIFVDINGLLVPFFIDKQAWRKEDAKLLLFKNSTEAMVEQLIGKDVYMPLSTLPELTGNQFYYHEVIGYTVYDCEETNYGVIQSVNDFTAQHYFVLKLNGKDVVVPIIKDWIMEVNREEKFIKMNLPEGLIDVFTKPVVKDE